MTSVTVANIKDYVNQLDVARNGADGEPAHVTFTVLCGLNGTNIVPIKVDSSGRIVYILSDTAEV